MTREDNSFTAAAIPEPYVVLGLSLRPFSLGHYIWLRRLECCYVSSEAATPTREDLILACLVCSMSFDDFSRWVCAERLPLITRLWAAAKAILRLRLSEARIAWDGLESELLVMRWGRRVGFFDLKEKSELFQRYLKSNSQLPKFWVEKEESKQCGGDWAQSVFLALTGDCGFTREQAYNMPLREAFLHFFRNAEKHGAVTLMTEGELELAEGLTA